MEFRYMKYFVAVAKAKHFTRAAEQLGIAQPPLSQQIKKLEDELGVTLFKRLPRGVELTAAGEVFYHDAQHILEEVERCQHKLEQIARGEKQELRIGFASSTASSRSVLENIRQLHEQCPTLHLIAVEHSMPELVTLLKQQRLELAFLRLPCYASESLNHQILFDDPFVAVMPINHRLAAHSTLYLAQLHNENVLMFPRDTGPALYDRIEAALHHAGVHIAQPYAAPQLRTAITMAQAGFGIAIVPLSLTEHLDQSVVIQHLNDMPFVSQVALVWNSRHHHPLINSSIQCMRSPTKQ
ncbi:transcriptional regulator of alpha-acetolactate operon AlsR [Vibrio metschnikovii]|uniref:LysR family transcriptional regulator n=1 Tax=Vibrio metschnikovii TaxID=28172 RepID=UPI0001B942ED|nr:LysR family transcriptional regulator [Vibrio metschnikovii]EEX37305.1 transcriptional regulator of alpha-acetolactate operon AlsR [Vibrio metschnikovii CIP 69.14]EKO3566268.1 LysR family transcriptional regulator [Vibrio metschnikovii]EKO3768000.1 LysR family transcriptional regulator [Vibrio metschnikovii]SUP08772.1 transcriptional regulator of alpha-acetolactate operon AlsR [Vibrio metschnikovii]SUP51848.1 transcriptional regulator of alpha-acetolactate operon AlsR [Vibrio metschnikovii]